MKKFLQIIGSRNVFYVCLLLLLGGYMKGWYSSGVVFFGLAVIMVLGISSAVISRTDNK